MRIDRTEFAQFARQYAELTGRARKYFEERAKTFNSQLRHTIEKIEFQDDGCTITYRSSHCSSCRDRDDIDEMYVSLDELIEFNEE